MNGVSEFSGGYFSADLRIEEYEDGPVVAQQLYDYIEYRLYPQTDAPPWFTDGEKVGEPYFRVEPEAGLPSDVIGLPEEYLDDFELVADFRPKMFLIAKPAFAHFLSQSATIGERLPYNDVDESV